jgi:hypothetical protein
LAEDFQAREYKLERTCAFDVGEEDLEELVQEVSGLGCLLEGKSMSAQELPHCSLGSLTVLRV